MYVRIFQVKGTTVWIRLTLWGFVYQSVAIRVNGMDTYIHIYVYTHITGQRHHSLDQAYVMGVRVSVCSY